MIGYYAHSHGSGHCNFASSFAHELGDKLTIFTAREENFDTNFKVVKLPDDYKDGTEFTDKAFKLPKALHYAPVNLRKVTRRNQIILQTILDRKIKLLIVDVSVEVAMLARVSSIPYIYRRQPGNRNDFAHLNAYEGAAFLIAYYPQELENDATPDWVVDKTIYLGFISKHLVRGDSNKYEIDLPTNHKKNLFHILGFGGTEQIEFEDLRAEYNILVIGPRNSKRDTVFDQHYGVVPSTRPYIELADIVFAACGANATSEILSLGKRFIAIPEIRPFDEQRYTAKSLEKLGWGIDYSKYRSAKTAVNAFDNAKTTSLPDFGIEKLKVFCSQLVYFDFQLDKFCSHSAIFEEEISF